MNEVQEQGWVAGKALALWRRADYLWNTRGAHINAFVARVDSYADQFSVYESADIAQRAVQLRQNISLEGVSEEFLSEVFALVRECSDRALGLRHYPEQILGGWVMFNGMVAEMETGQGKTLTAVLPAVAAALAGVPTHVITVNEYLAQRDAETMAPVYAMFGLAVSVVLNDMSHEEKKAAYQCDVVYCTNKQVAFDHLRDRMVMGNSGGQVHLRLETLYKQAPSTEKLLLPGLCFAIIDEADSVLVDEAVTPLIISREVSMNDKKAVYQVALKLAGELLAGEHFQVLENIRHLEFTEEGKATLKERALLLGGLWNATLTREELVLQALKAMYLFARDEQYLVVDGKIQIVDEFTGRIMADRSWEKGLHQMIELKEGCELTSDRDTIARISYQRFFQRYMNIAGMTGTAREITNELFQVYGLQVYKVPSAQPNQRQYFADTICQTVAQKWQRVLSRVQEIHKSGRPVLIGTASVQASETLSQLLAQQGLDHNLLNARQDLEEAAIIAEAGQVGRITVATNMAGRGTDIKLGPGVRELGGLHVIATERHDSRRVDRQLFGRCGRQGDKGSVEVIVSLEDAIVRLNCPQILRKLLRAGGNQRLAKTLITVAQWIVERRHYNTRRNVMQTDDYYTTALAFTGRME